MSTTLPGPAAVPSVDNRAPAQDPAAAHPAVRSLGPITLGIGALLTAAGLALHLGAMPEDERLAQAIADDPQWAASHLLLGIGLALVGVGLASAVTLVRGRGARFAGVGAVLASLGAILMALSDYAHGALGIALRDQVDAAQSFDIHLAYFEQPAILAVNTGPLLLTLGLLVLGVGLLRSRDVPRWAALAVPLTPIAVNISFTLGLPPVMQALPFLVGMLVLAMTMRRAVAA